MVTEQDAASHAERFAALGDPTRLRLLHLLSASGAGGLEVAALAEALGISRSTCSHHVDLLRSAGIVIGGEAGRAGSVSVAPRCSTELPHPVDAVLGLLASPTGPPAGRPAGPPADVVVRHVDDGDLPVVLAIYAEGLATRNATFETELPTAEQLRAKWLPDLAWVAELQGAVVGWTAVMPVSARSCYAGVGETSVYVAGDARGRGVGGALLRAQVRAADAAGLWTLQTSIFPENRASLALHRTAGYRTVGIRARVAQLDGVWRDTVLLERRSEVG
jgi:L-amino acid N-acyltransferase YncA